MKKRRLVSLLAFCCIMTAGTGILSACDFDFSSCVGQFTQDKTPKVEFFEGYLEEIALGDSIQIRDYVPEEILSYKTEDGKKGYKFEMQFGEEVYDLTNRATFIPEAIGEWKMILTVGEKKVEATLTVKGRMLTWADHTKPSIEYELGTDTATLDLVATLESMELEVFSDVEYETYISSVLIGSTNPVRVDLKGETTYTFEVNDIHIFEYKTVAVDGQVISANFPALPKTSETKEYIKKDTNYPFRDWYGGTNIGRAILKPELATDGYYVDSISYVYTDDQDWCGVRANAALFKKYIDAGAKEIKFDIYNSDALDHTYTVFHHLKTEKLPEGSQGDLKSGEWTTITITKAMLDEAFACALEDYMPIENNDKYTSMSQHGVYGWSKKSGSSASNFVFTFAIHNSAYVQGVPGNKMQFYVDNVRVCDADNQEIPVRLLPDVQVQPKPIVDKVATYWGSENHFNVGYAGTNVSSTIEMENATEGEHVDVIKYSYNTENTFAGIRANQKFFADYYYGWNGKSKLQTITFDIYNADTVDHTYTLFHHLKAENRPKGSTGTLKAGQWTTITITREMLATAYTQTEPGGTVENLNAAYVSTSDGVYACYRQTWVKDAGFNVIAFSIAIEISNYDKLNEGDKIAFYLDNVEISDVSQIPEEEITDKVVSYWGTTDTSPFRVAYTATKVEGGVAFDQATDGALADKITYTYNADVNFACLRANAKAFGDYYRGWNGKSKLETITFDIYNADTVDHTYTLFHHLKAENRPEGSTDTLKAGQWTTITITKAMLDAAYTFAGPASNIDAVNAAYDRTEDGIYETYQQTWVKNANLDIYAFTVAMNISSHGELTAGKTVSFYLDNMQMLLVDGTTVDVGA